MPLVDHIAITVEDLPRAIAQFDPVLTTLGMRRCDSAGSAAWFTPGETEIILYPAREARIGPHRHGRVGWQHLAFATDSRQDVDRLHSVAVAAGWTVVREPRLYPRFGERYYAAFAEDANGIRVEFMHNPPATR